MNERIKELYKQAGLTMNNPLAYEQWYLDSLEKFAELIVRECGKVSEDDVSDGDACCTNTAYRIARQIKKHFGVEE